MTMTVIGLVPVHQPSYISLTLLFLLSTPTLLFFILTKLNLSSQTLLLSILTPSLHTKNTIANNSNSNKRKNQGGLRLILLLISISRENWGEDCEAVFSSLYRCSLIIQPVTIPTTKENPENNKINQKVGKCSALSKIGSWSSTNRPIKTNTPLIKITYPHFYPSIKFLSICQINPPTKVKMNMMAGTSSSSIIITPI